MTNTLNTPIEAIERDFPLRVVRYELARGTGGAGAHRGGDGLIRAIAVRDGPAHVSLLADRHTLAPPGARGGEPGACGEHLIERAGRTVRVAAKTSIALEPGDTVIVKTPGGGGYGGRAP